MGACFSFKASGTEVRFKTIRVVHLNGSLEEYEDPATVDQVVSSFPNHFLCTPLQILQTGLVPLQHDHQLRSGQIYFMLPYSTLKFNSSPMDLTSLTRKLTNIAKSSHGRAQPIPTSPSASPLCNPRASNPSRVLDRWCVDGVESMPNWHNSPSWKPILATITEGTFNQIS